MSGGTSGARAFSSTDSSRGRQRALQKSHGSANSLNVLINEDGDEENHVSGSIKEKSLGTIKGVFSPVSLSMFSTILFLRMGYIVGNAGFLQTAIIFGISYIILGSTVLSICAIATNGAVKGGGVYFMLSRTMGPEFGGSIGSLFYLANIAGSALNAVACTEGIVSNFGPLGTVLQILPDGRWWKVLYATVVNILNLMLCLIGAELFGKVSLLILVSVMCCTLGVGSSFFREDTFLIPYNETLDNVTTLVNGTFIGLSDNTLGGISDLWNSNFDGTYQQDCSNPDAPVDFFTVFGVVFSGVTGVMAGANLSGELKSPARSIPIGTLSACLLTFVTFITLSLLTALTCDKALLLNDCLYMIQFTWWKGFILIGVILATWSASLSNLIGGSRVLDAIAKDTMFGPFLHFVTKGTFKNNPIVAVIITSVIVQLFFFIGGLNEIAQLASVLFLLSYSAVNIACLGLDIASAPNFRPNFRYFHWSTCLVGLLGTSTMIFFISKVFASVAVFVSLSLMIILHFFSPAKNQNWGHLSQALIFHQVRKYLLLLDARKAHIKFWRPQMLLLVHNPKSSCSLIHFVNSMKKSGLYIIGHVKKGDFDETQVDPTINQINDWLELIDHLNIKAFVELTMAETIRKGVRQLIRLSGIGGMKPNTVLMGFPEAKSHKNDLSEPDSPYYNSDLAQKNFLNPDDKISSTEYVSMMTDTLKLEKNLILCRHFQKLNESELFKSERKFLKKTKKSQYLDIWPINFFSHLETDISDNTSLFLMQIACIVHMVPHWKDLKLRIFTLSKEATDEEIIEKERILKDMLENLRIRAQPYILRYEDELGNQENSTDLIKNSNQFLKMKCEDTAVLFLYLPLPPNNSDQENYLSQLDQLTDGLPPLLLVHGLRPVITTNL